MQTIDNQGLVKLIKANPDIAYVATATTPWHAIGVVASVLSQGLENKRGIVLINIHDTYGKPLIDESNFSQLGNSVEVYISTRNQNKIKTVVNLLRFTTCANSGDRTISVISARNINLHIASAIKLNTNGTNVNLIKYDEGLATYFPQGKVERNRNIVTKLIRIVDKLFIKLYSIFYKSSNACLFYQKKDNVTINESIIPYYKRAIESTSEESGVENISLFEDSVIICPNAWQRGKVTDNADTKVVLSILKHLQSNNIKFVIKLHPRDTWSKDIYKDYLSFIYNTSGVSMETILSSVKTPARALIGFSSTVLVTAKLFWDLRVVNIADLVDNTQLGQMYWNEKYYFTKIFGNYVASPKTLDELYKLISE